MGGKRVLLECPSELWQRMRERAKEEGVFVTVLAARYFRAGLAGYIEKPMVTAEAQLRNQRPVSVVGTTGGTATVEVSRGTSVRDLPIPERKAHIEALLAARTVPAGTPSEPWDDLHDQGHPLSARELERRRLARLEHARSHPEDVPQD